MKTSRKHAGIWFQSTHSLRSATSNGKKISLAATFQSTHSLRSATMERMGISVKYMVSIHALLAECDYSFKLATLQSKRFNPRTPCGVRPVKIGVLNNVLMFQSTHSLRSATSSLPFKNMSTLVSIHALLAECDRIFPEMGSPKFCFNPRTPCGVRPVISAWSKSL